MTLLVALPLAQQTFSHTGSDNSATEVGLSASAYSLSASGADANGSLTAPSSKAEDTHSAGSRATVAQIKRLIEFEQAPAFNPPGGSSAASVNTCVEHYLREVDPNNRDWNPSDPRWDKMRAVISQGCTAQADDYKERVAPVLLNAYSEAIGRSYENHLSSDGADTLIRFYESEVGQRYLAFQGELTAVGGRGMGRLFAGMAGADSRASTPEATKSRMQLLRLSRTFSMLIVATEDARKTGGDASGAMAIAIMMHVTAETQGYSLDRIAREYSADLPNFVEFAQSPAEMEELRALFDATDAANKAAAKVAVEVSPELNGNLNKWRNLYRSLPRNK
ncbi:DUF2059 domain-containing protein [Burkholderia sp. Bp8998]|uniref:DUF2059 domain-containing protein n=1 Tax=Burkholderia sp. Bp8998 TaxID=2184557 RepID=UPI000F5B0BB9|nr:DUF2059 domain-containing protein [Burkholderia sp. Bp8998]